MEVIVYEIRNNARRSERILVISKQENMHVEYLATVYYSLVADCWSCVSIGGIDLITTDDRDEVEAYVEYLRAKDVISSEEAHIIEICSLLARHFCFLTKFDIIVVSDDCQTILSKQSK